MKLLIALLVLAIGCSICAEAQSSQEQTFRPGVGIKGVNIGDTRTSVEHAYGTPYENSTTVASYPDLGMSVYFSKEGRVSGLLLTSKFSGKLLGKAQIMKMTGPEIVAVLGEPTQRQEREDEETLYFAKTAVTFKLIAGHVHHIIQRTPKQ